MASGNKPPKAPKPRQLPRCQKANYKVKFKTRQDALDEMRFRQALNANGKVPVRTYRCDHCRKWHLTSQEKFGDVT